VCVCGGSVDVEICEFDVGWWFVFVLFDAFRGCRGGVSCVCGMCVF